MSEEKRILVARSSMPPFEEYVEAIKPLWDSVWLTNMGANHELLGKELKEYLKVPGISLFTNAHMALELTIKALGLTGEVITTPFTFVSTTHAIVRNGLTPVFCDINPVDYTMDVDRIESLITERTSAIIPVHVYGNLCNVEKIEEIAKKHNLKVIYDAAHAFGTEYKGKGVGTFGDASMFSFHATKVYHTIEGGCITTASQKLIDDLFRFRDFGILDEETIDCVGANAKMNEFQAVMGRLNLKYVDGEIAKRAAIVERYRSHLADVPGLRIWQGQENVKPNYAYCPLVIDETVFGCDRNQVMEELKKHNVFVRKYFYPLTNLCDCYVEQYGDADVPVAKWTSEHVLTLPMSASLELEDVDRICNVILSMAK